MRSPKSDTINTNINNIVNKCLIYYISHNWRVTINFWFSIQEFPFSKKFITLSPILSNHPFEISNCTHYICNRTLRQDWLIIKLKSPHWEWNAEYLVKGIVFRKGERWNNGHLRRQISGIIMSRGAMHLCK